MESKMTVMKEGLLEEIEKRVQDKVLEKTNGDLLKKLIRNADSDREAIFITSLGTTYKRTGLHYDKRFERMDTTIHYFKKNEELSFRSDVVAPNLFDSASKDLTHLLIVGDNYDALQNLLIEYRGKVDVVYIDPPYGKDNMGEYAQTNYENSITRDNLLSMLYSRLVIARNLLSKEGIVFCSIDDRNYAYIKCLFDDVFGEQNCIATLPTIMNLKGNQDEFGFAGTHEYTLVFAKSKDSCTIRNYDVDEDDMDEWEIDDVGYYKKGANLKSTGVNAPRAKRPNLYYPILINKQTMKVSSITEEEYLASHTNDFDIDDQVISDIKKKYEALGFTVLLPITEGSQMSWRWQWSTVKDKTDDIIVALNGTYSIYKKQRPELSDLPSKKPKTLFYKAQYSSGNGTGQHKAIFGTKLFDNPKPIELIRDFIFLSSKPDSVILDFYAGSGTTGHAVIDLNKRDGGNRKFILCQLNEKTDTTPNGIAYDVTSKRLKRIMTGRCYDGSSDFQWARDNQPYGGNLDVYEIGTVSNFETTEGKTPFHVIDETLYGQRKFDTLREKIDWVCSNFAHTQKYVEAYEDWEKRARGE